MKKSLGSLMSLAALSSLALAFASNPAQAFWVRAQTTVSGLEATAQVENFYGQPMDCRVQVAGMRNDGLVQTAWAQLYILPGQFEYAYVYTSYPFVFVNAQAQADCSFSE